MSNRHRRRGRGAEDRLALRLALKRLEHYGPVIAGRPDHPNAPFILTSLLSGIIPEGKRFMNRTINYLIVCLALLLVCGTAGPLRAQTSGQSGYIGVFYYSTPPSPCPANLSVLCAANNTVNNANGGLQDGPVFIFVNTSDTPITNAVLTVVGVDSYNVGTIPANSSVSVIPGVSDDGQNHGSSNFFTVTGSVYDTSDDGPDDATTQFKFTGQQGGTQIQSIDVCGAIPAPIFTPACTAAPANDGTLTTINFLGGPDDGPCNNCFGPAIVAYLGSAASASTPSITTTSIPNGTVLTASSQTLTAAGGKAPYTWTVAGGSLPPGMGLSSAGVLSGTPTNAGVYTFSLKVTDAAGAFAVETVTLTVAAQPVTVTTPSPLPSGMVTVQYPQQVLTASGGNPPYTFTVPANPLPAGLSLSPGGAIFGTPTVTGTFTFTLTATDATGQAGNASLSITIRPFSADLIMSAGSLSFALAAGAATLPLSETVQVESTDVTKILSLFDDGHAGGILAERVCRRHDSGSVSPPA